MYAVAASGLVLTYTTSGVFNIAHGAVGMLMAFLYWQLREDWGWPTPLALAVVLLVVAPLFGVFVDRVLARNLAKAPLVSSLVVTIGLLLVLMGLAFRIWEPRGRLVHGFFEPGGFDVGSVFVTWHQATTVLVALAVAVGLRLFMFGTRMGITMRAVVDNRALAALTGGRPSRASSLAWALGCSLAALAGILLAPVLQLNVQALTLLVVNAYAAAMFGRLRSVPLTFVGAVVLGLLESYAVGYLPTTGAFANVRLAIPTLMLFVVLLVLPEVRLRNGSDVAAHMPRLASARRSLLAGGALVLAAALFAGVAADGTLAEVGQGLALAVIALSLVPLTGWAGQVSLCQMTFAGIGAFAAVKVAPDGGALGLLAAALLAAPVGALVALPALRLRGLYLALATLAFAVFMDNVFFNHERVFGEFGTLRMGRLPGFESEGAYFVLLAMVFALVAMALLAVRRGRFGRRLAAMRDSPAACTTLGLDLTMTKLTVFALSSAIAGLGGALLAGLNLGASARPFTMFQSLPLVLLAVLGGITATSGALVGGLILAGFPVLAETAAFAALNFLGPGIIGVTLARQPDGIVLWLSDTWRGRRRLAREEGMPEHLEDLGTAVPFEPGHAETLDRALALEGV